MKLRSNIWIERRRCESSNLPMPLIMCLRSLSLARCYELRIFFQRPVFYTLRFTHHFVSKVYSSTSLFSEFGVKVAVKVQFFFSLIKLANCGSGGGGGGGKHAAKTTPLWPGVPVLAGFFRASKSEQQLAKNSLVKISPVLTPVSVSVALRDREKWGPELD